MSVENQGQPPVTQTLGEQGKDNRFAQEVGEKDASSAADVARQNLFHDRLDAIHSCLKGRYPFITTIESGLDAAAWEREYLRDALRTAVIELELTRQALDLFKRGDPPQYREESYAKARGDAWDAIYKSRFALERHLSEHDGSSDASVKPESASAPSVVLAHKEERCLVCNGLGGHEEGCRGTSAYDALWEERGAELTNTVPAQNTLYGKSNEELLELAVQVRSRAWSLTVEGEVLRRLTMVDQLLNHCDKEGGECSECSRIVCPFGEPLHFHHDGCPACVTLDAPSGPGGSKSSDASSSPNSIAQTLEEKEASKASSIAVLQNALEGILATEDAAIGGRRCDCLSRSRAWLIGKCDYCAARRALSESRAQSVALGGQPADASSKPKSSSSTPMTELP